MIFRAGINYFQTEHIVRIQRIAERDPLKEPVRYSIYLVGQLNGVDVFGDDLAPFEAWLAKEILKTDAEVKPKAPDAKKVA